MTLNLVSYLTALWLLLGMANINASAQDSTFAYKYKKYKRGNYKRIDSLKGALNPERSCFDVHYYDLHLQINPKNKTIKGHNAIHFKITKPTQKIQLDLYKNLQIDSVFYQNQKLKFWREHHAFFIDFPQTLEENTLHRVVVYYKGKPHETETSNGKAGFIWSQDRQCRDWIGVSCEYLGASYWWPNKDHLSDEPDSMRLHYIVPKKLSCIANGTLESKNEFDDKYTQYNWLIRNPINNYNVTFYLGHYIEKVIYYENKNGKYPIYLYALDYEKSNMDEYFKSVPNMLSFMEAVYGEYPYWNDKFAILQSPYGGMEHQGCLAIGPHLSNFENWYYKFNVNWHSTLIHEIAHEWWGNSVSVADIADVWLHESFATYTEMFYLEYKSGYKKYEEGINYYKQFLSKSYPIVGNKEVRDDMWKESDIYHGGALVIHELREEINDMNTFLKILRTFQSRFKNKTVSTQDFINVVNEITQKDYTKFLMDRLYKK
jgi:aminopeptidase N